MSTTRPDWGTTIKIGVLGGIVAVFVALIGMVEAFATRDIVGGVIDMGHISILIVFFLTGYFAITRGYKPAARSIMTILQGGLAGLFAGLMLALLAVLLSAQPAMRTVFVNATPLLLKLLIFDQGLATGVMMLMVLGAFVGLVPALLQFLPGSARRSLITAAAWVILIGLLQELLTVTFRSTEALDALSTLLFAQSGLSVNGAIALFLVIFTFEFLRAERGNAIRKRIAELPSTQQQIGKVVVVLIGLMILIALPSVLGLFFSAVLVQVGLYVLMGLGLNIVVGFAGLLDLGYVAFFAIGAYTTAIFTTTSKEIVYAGAFPFWVGLPIAIVMCIFAGILLGIPVLKVRGDYLAIVTLGFGEIIRLLALSDFLKPYLGGSRGVELIPKPVIGSFEFAGPQELYFLILVGCVIVAFLSLRLKNSRIGRAWMAVREDEDVAQAMGINLVATKLMAFAMGAAFAGIGGAINASYLAIIYPHSMNLLVSINVLALIIIGGMGSIPGVIVGALALVGLPELLREFADFRLLVYGALLVFMMLIRPEGLLPEARRQLELEEFKTEENVAAQPKLVGEPSEVQTVLKTPGQ